MKKQNIIIGKNIEITMPSVLYGSSAAWINSGGRNLIARREIDIAMIINIFLLFLSLNNSILFRTRKTMVYMIMKSRNFAKKNSSYALTSKKISITNWKINSREFLNPSRSWASPSTGPALTRDRVIRESSVIGILFFILVDGFSGLYILLEVGFCVCFGEVRNGGGGNSDFVF